MRAELVLETNMEAIIVPLKHHKIIYLHFVSMFSSLINVVQLDKPSNIKHIKHNL